MLSLYYGLLKPNAVALATMAFYNVNHNPLAFTFGILGNIISFLMFLALAPTFYRIYQDRSAGEFKSLPYLVGLFSSMLWLYYGLLKPNTTALVTINSVGFIVELVYIFMFITFATGGAKKLTIRLFVEMNVVGFSMIFLFIQLVLRDPIFRIQFLGWVSVGVSVCVFGAPLSIMVPNVIGFILGIAQMVLYGVYRH